MEERENCYLGTISALLPLLLYVSATTERSGPIPSQPNLSHYCSHLLGAQAFLCEVTTLCDLVMEEW